MLLKSIAIAIAASVAGVLAAAPTASAAAPGVSIQGWGSGNCPQGKLCIWPNWNHPPQGPVETPSLTTDSEWTGSIQGFTFYNGTGRDAVISGFTFGSSTPFKNCAPAGGTGGDLYIPVNVTKVTWQLTPC
ncbi:hypothetical protein LADH09A_004179 [Micromonospora sp. LAH09]|uniref:hypothetical protein n=1 Tax=Micromonospora cabrerizensis TaxID=2911213 RepID=UPI001EE91E46|nr:hypothetical protein [Micromonospora cabrerizensis]MCG5470235.1 hypothetical protein [Micromonospora cabrerizensis]